MKQFESVFTRGLVVGALCLTVGIAQPGRAEDATQQLPEPAFLRVDTTRKPVVEGGIPKEVATSPNLARSVYRPDSALPYPDLAASANGPSSAVPKRAPAITGSINIEGNSFYNLAATTGYFTVDRVANHRSSGTGTLRLELWATANSPASGSVFGYQLATYSLGTLPVGGFFYNINSGTFNYTQPPAGCYYMSLLLTEFDGSAYPYFDYAVFTNRLTFGGGSCSGCTEDAYTMCLIGGRYRVTSHWRNQYAGGATANLSKAKLTDATGAFWIADASTYEYLIRFNTATNNGRAWIAIPTFTDVEFWVGVTDTVNGQTKEYHSNPGNQTLIYDPYYFVYP